MGSTENAKQGSQEKRPEAVPGSTSSLCSQTLSDSPTSVGIMHFLQTSRLGTRVVRGLERRAPGQRGGAAEAEPIAAAPDFVYLPVSASPGFPAAPALEG